MPIGKNAIKRVSNGGYSNVQTTAPDMENSVVAEEKVQEAPKVEEIAPVVEASPVVEKAPKKTTKKAAPKKSMEAEPEVSFVNTAKKVTKKPTKKEKAEEKSYINIGGGDLPYYLL